MFPNARMPVHAQFVKQRLDALSKLADLTVISPIPWFPGETLIARYRNRHAIPLESAANAYPTYFPKFFSIPALFKPLEGLTMAWRIARFLVGRGQWKRFDIIDCHLGFPEGFAGAWLKFFMRRPLTVTLRGHDINDLYRYPVRKKQVVFGLKRADRYFGVSQALVDGAIRLGAPSATGFRSSNGVNAERFRPLPKPEARRLLQLPGQGPLMMSVCHLNARKGVDILIRALAILRAGGMPDLHYLIVGKGGEEGDEEANLRRLADDLGVADGITWAGAVLNEDLYRYYSAADFSCLASAKEGWPNVILESLACGTPVVATATWGVPEILCRPDLGVLVQERNAESFAQAILEARDYPWKSGDLVAYAAEHSWDKVASGLMRHFQSILDQAKP